MSNFTQVYEDIHRFKTEFGASGVMLARKALTNPSIFSGRMLPMDEVVIISQYVS